MSTELVLLCVYTVAIFAVGFLRGWVVCRRHLGSGYRPRGPAIPKNPPQSGTGAK